MNSCRWDVDVPDHCSVRVPMASSAVNVGQMVWQGKGAGHVSSPSYAMSRLGTQAKLIWWGGIANAAAGPVVGRTEQI